MARPRKDSPLDLAQPLKLSAGAIERLACPPSKEQAFLRDTEAPGLRVRVTASGTKSFIFEAKLNRQTIRRTIGDVRAWGIEEARVEANRLRVLLDNGNDPRQLDREHQVAAQAALDAAAAQQVTVSDAWTVYLAEGKPKRRDAWKPRYLADLKLMAEPGGKQKKRGDGKTRPGPIFPLLALPLGTLNEDVLRRWYDREAKAGKHQAARAWMMFKGLLRWCCTRPEYRALVDRGTASGEWVKDDLPPNTKRKDALEVAQIPGWFAGADALGNKTIATYLKALLLTGARRQEMAALKWADVDFRWRKVTLADKVHASRTIPLAPYLEYLLAALPRVNEFVFASTSKSGYIAEPRAAHANVQAHAGIQGLTVHGLRRSFSLLGEAAGAPDGAIRQVMGHSAADVAEGYRPRSIDALRPYLVQIEKHILATAGIEFDADAQQPGFRVVSAK